MDVSRAGTQAEFAQLIGVDQSSVSDFVSRGLITPGETLAEWLLAYCRRLRGVAAGRGGDDGLELSAERAALAREQRIKIEMQNAVTRKELAPARVVEDILASAATRMSRVLDTIPGEIKRRVAGATADDIAAVSDVVAKARNVIAAIERKDIFAGAVTSTTQRDDALEDAA